MANLPLLRGRVTALLVGSVLAEEGGRRFREAGVGDGTCIDSWSTTILALKIRDGKTWKRAHYASRV